MFSAAGQRKEVAAVLQQVEASAQKLSKSPDETLLAVADTRAAKKLMPEAASALLALGHDSSSQPAPTSSSASLVRVLYFYSLLLDAYS